MAMAMPGVRQALNVAIIIRSVDKFSRTFGLAASQAVNLRGKYGALIGTISAMMDPYTIALSLMMAVAVAMIKCTQAAMDFEYRMVEIRKVYQGNAEYVDSDLIPAIKGIGEQYGLTADEVSASMVKWAQQGRKGIELQELTEQAIRLTMVTMIGEADATAFLTAAINQFGLTVDDTNHIIAVWNHLGNTQMVTAAFLADALQDVGASAREYGVSIDVASTYLTLLSRAGFKAGEAGKGLQMIFQKTFSKSSMKYLAAVGISIYDANMNFRDMDDVLGELAGKWDTLTDYQRKNLGESMAGRRHIVKFNILMRDFADTTTMLASETDMLNSVEEEVNRTLGTAQKQVDILKSKFHNLALKIGDGFLPIVKTAAIVLGGWVTTTSDVLDALAPFGTAITDLFLPLDELKDKYGDVEGSLRDYYDTLVDIRQEQADWLAALEEEVALLAETNEWYARNTDSINAQNKAIAIGNPLMAIGIGNQMLINEWMLENTEVIDDLTKEWNTFTRVLNELLQPLVNFLITCGLINPELDTLDKRSNSLVGTLDLLLIPTFRTIIWLIQQMTQELIKFRQTQELVDEGFKSMGITTATGPGKTGGLKSTVDWWTKLITGSRPFGGRIYREGMYKLEPGEEVKTPGQTGGQSFGDININISGVIGGDVREWVQKLKDELKYELRGKGLM